MTEDYVFSAEELAAIAIDYFYNNFDEESLKYAFGDEVKQFLSQFESNPIKIVDAAHIVAESPFFSLTRNEYDSVWEDAARLLSDSLMYCYDPVVCKALNGQNHGQNHSEQR